MSLLSTLFANHAPRAISVRARTLIYLRWLAILGQSIAVIVAYEFLGIDLRLDLCILIIGMSVALNIGQILILPENMRLNQRDAAIVLLVDIVQLVALLYLTGGLANPFAALLLAQTIIAATVLTLYATVFLAGATLIFIALLAVFHQPLMMVNGDIMETPRLLVIGSWAALSIAVIFLGVYARIVTTETGNMAEALTATQLALEREQKLTALGGVVAAAAHELGTPLATIMMAAAEMEDELDDRPDLAEDIRLIREQAERCRHILASMGRIGKEDLHLLQAPFETVVEEAAEPHMERGAKVIIRCRNKRIDTDRHIDQPSISRRAEVIHGVRNLVQNAVDFAQSTVWVDMDWTDEVISLRVGDDGRGYPPELLGRIGDPYLRRRGMRAGADPDRPGYDGMGLGLFIAKTLLERTGATLTFTNGVRDGADRGRRHTATPPGAIVEVVWPRYAIVVEREDLRGALGENRRLDAG